MEGLARQVLAVHLRTLGKDSRSTLNSLGLLANVLMNEGHPDEAEPAFRDVLEGTRRLYGPEHIFTVSAMTDLADSIVEQGRYDEGEELDRQAFAIENRVLGQRDPSTLRTQERLADVLGRKGRYDEAEKMFREVILETKAPLDRAKAWYSLACLAAKSRRHEDAIRDLDRSVDEGFRLPEWIAADPDLNSLHGDPRFDALVAKARQAGR